MKSLDPATARPGRLTHAVTHPARDAGARAPPARHVVRRAARRRLPHRHARAGRHAAPQLRHPLHRRQRRHRRRRPQRHRPGHRRRPTGRIPASLVDDVAPGRRRRRRRAGRHGFGQLLGADGEAVGGGGPPQLAGSWIDDPDLNPYRLAEGRAPEARRRGGGQPGAADAGDLAVGDTTTVLTPEPVEVTIVGIATFGDEDGLGGVTFTAFDLDDAMAHVARSPDQVTSISVRGDDRRRQAALADRVRRGAARRASRRSPVATVSQESTDDINELFLDMLTTFLTLFAGIALLVATFSIYNTFSIIVAQRTRAGRAAAGARRPAGAGAAGRRGRGRARRRDRLGRRPRRRRRHRRAAQGPVRRGRVRAARRRRRRHRRHGRRRPGGRRAGHAAGRACSRRSRPRGSPRWRPCARWRSSARRPSRARVVVGTVLAAAGVGLSLAGALSDGDGALPLVGLGALVLVVAAVVAGPVVARPAAGLLGAPLARLRGMTGELARENAMRNPRRTAGTASALMVGVAVVTLFTVFAASLKASMDDTIDRSFGGDLVVSTGPFGGGGISPELAGEVADAARGRHRGRHRPGRARVDGATKQLSIADPAALAEVLDVDVTAGDLADVGAGSVAVSTTTAESHDWAVGDAVPVTFADGQTEDLTVAAIYDSEDMARDRRLPRAPHGVGAPHRAGRRHDGAGHRGRRRVGGRGRGGGHRRGRPLRRPRRRGPRRVRGHDDRRRRHDADASSTSCWRWPSSSPSWASPTRCRCRSTSGPGSSACCGPSARPGRRCGRWCGGSRWSSPCSAPSAASGSACSSAGPWCRASPPPRAGWACSPCRPCAWRWCWWSGGVAGVLAGLRPARRAARLDVLQAIATE